MRPRAADARGADGRAGRWQFAPLTAGGAVLRVGVSVAGGGGGVLLRGRLRPGPWWCTVPEASW